MVRKLGSILRVLIFNSYFHFGSCIDFIRGEGEGEGVGRCWERKGVTGYAESEGKGLRVEGQVEIDNRRGNVRGQWVEIGKSKKKKGTGESLFIILFV